MLPAGATPLDIRKGSYMNNQKIKNFILILIAICFTQCHTFTTTWDSTLSNGLVAYYPFDGNANDESGHNLHGEIIGAVLSEDRFGNESSSYYFDGFDDYINIGNSSLLNIRNNLSISVWVKGRASDHVSKESFAGIVAKGALRPYGLGIDNGDRLIFGIASSSDYYESRLTGIETDPSQWMHYVGVFESGKSIRLYINGLEVRNNISSIPSQIDSSEYELWIGTRAHSKSPYKPRYFFRGNIDELKIYNRALSLSEIMELMD